MSIAAGIASFGHPVVFTAYGVFATEKPFEQIRNTICYPNLNVKIIATHGGISVGEDGATHQAIEDIAVMRSLPNMKVIVAADPGEVKAAVFEAIRTPGPVYVRLGRSVGGCIHEVPDHVAYEIGKAERLRAGNDVTVIAAGIMVEQSLYAADLLEKQGVSAEVINVRSVKPIDTEMITGSAEKTGAIVTAEDHNCCGGLFGAVAEAAALSVPVPIEYVALQDMFGESGNGKELLDKYGLNAKREEDLAKKLAEYKASLSLEEQQAVVDFTHHLKQYQEEPSAPEALDTIPMLSREDIKKTGEKLYIREHRTDDTLMLCHDIDTNGIAYFSLLFDVGEIAREDIPWLGILKSVLGYVDTASHSFQELANEINLHTGGIFSEIGIYPHARENRILLKYEIKIKTLYHEIPKTAEIVREILSGSNFRRHERLYEILAQLKSRLQISLSSSGHSVSSIRAMSYFSESARYTDMVQGIEFYQLVKDLEEHFSEKKDFISKKLEALMPFIFRRDNLMISIGAEPEGMEALEQELPAVKAVLSEQIPEKSEPSISLEKKNEGFLDASQVQYVSRAGNFKRAGYEYTGTLRILKVLLSYDYLWLNIRVKGGAYGCMSGFTRRGDGYFTSYRDPNLSKTNEVYEGIPEYLEQFQATEKEMTGYILGTFSSVDAPLTPAGKTGRSATAYLTGITEETLQKEREEILKATQEDIRSLSGIVRAILKENAFCVIGNEEKLKEEKELFLELKNL